TTSRTIPPTTAGSSPGTRRSATGSSAKQDPTATWSRPRSPPTPCGRRRRRRRSSYGSKSTPPSPAASPSTASASAATRSTQRWSSRCGKNRELSLFSGGRLLRGCPDRVEGLVGPQVEDTARDHRRRREVLVEGVLGEDLELAAGLHHGDRAVGGRAVDLAVGDHRGSAVPLLVGPLLVEFLPGQGLEADEDAVFSQ